MYAKNVTQDNAGSVCGAIHVRLAMYVSFLNVQHVRLVLHVKNAILENVEVVKSVMYAKNVTLESLVVVKSATLLRVAIHVTPAIFAKIVIPAK